MKFKPILLSFIFWSYPSFGQIYINEIMASNTKTIQDNTGIYSDWIEIYNAGASPVDLANYYISDAVSNLTKHKFPAIAGQVVIPANGYLMIWASGNTAAGVLHTNFSLSSTNGEYVYLVMPDGVTIVSGFAFPPQHDDISYGRESDGSVTLKYFSPSSPGASNISENAYSGFTNTPTFSQQGGFFQNSFNLTLSHPDPDVVIYYTADGSIPSSANLAGTTYSYKNSYPQNPGDPSGVFLSRLFRTNLYKTPINIHDKTSEANEVSSISSTWNLTPTYLPSYNIQKGMVVRAIATKPGFLPSDIETNTYLFSNSGQNPYIFSVIAVTMQENHLFDYNSGIYTAGITFDQFRQNNPATPADICSPGNFSGNGALWERPGNLEIIESQTNVINQPLSYRIHGSCSASAPYKSLRAYGQNKFDNYAFFPSKPNLFHDRIIFRNSGNDYNQTMFKDAFVHTWLGHLRFSSQKTRPSILYLNGEYWGIHNIRERIDKYYLNALYGVNENNLDLRNIVWDGPAEIEEGDSVHYTNMYDFITTHPMSDSVNFAQALQMLDPECLIDYQAAEIYVGNIDWPQNNVRLWRTRNPYNPNVKYNDGRWRWVLFDTDRALGEVVNYENYDLESLIENPANLLFKKLLENTNFKNSFINRYADLLNSSLKPDFATSIYASMRAQYALEAENHILRWKNLESMAAWYTQCEKVNTYLINRPASMLNQLKDYFGLSGTYNLTVSTPDTSKGFIRINTLEVRKSSPGLPLNTQSWTGLYFDNVPLKITAVPKFGYKFSYWIYNGVQLFDSTLTLLTSTDRSYQVFFEVAIISNNPIPQVAAKIASCGYSLTFWSATTQSGSSPANSKFVYLNSENPGITAEIGGYTSGVYNLTTKTRINGLEENGFSFINTSDGNEGYPGNKLGGFLMAINTQNLDSVNISWTGKTIVANPRKYKIRLYYREGDIQAFQDFSPIVEYSGNSVSGHSQIFANIKLPQSLIGKPYVQLFWKYYYTGQTTSGARDQLAIDDVLIKGIKLINGELVSNLPEGVNPNNNIITGKINSGINILNNAKDGILLLPGFEAKKGSTFKAEIKNCP